MLITSNLAHATEFTVGFSYAKPPYVFAQNPMQTDDMRGIEMDIMKQALAHSGHTFKPRFFAYDNLHAALAAGKIDAIATVRPEKEHVFYSEEFVYFKNYAITNLHDDKSVQTVADSSTRRIAAWQGARQDLGEDYEKAVNAAPVYHEMADQQQQAMMFLRNRVDTIIIDGAIFAHWAQVLGHDPREYQYNDIIGHKTSFVVGFKSKELRDIFNTGLKALKADRRYADIYQRYNTPENLNVE